MKKFKEQYNQVRATLKDTLGVSSVEAVPRLTRVSINIGAGAAVSDSNYLAPIEEALTQLAGQKPITTKARKSIAGFKLREGMPIGLAVTLRGQRMFDFVNKLINVSLPRVRDFQGLPDSSFDGHGNYTLGIREHVVFPEVSLDNVEKTFGLSVTIGTNAKTDEPAKALLRGLNFPFKKK